MSLLDVVNTSLSTSLSPDAIDQISRCSDSDLRKFYLTYIENWSIPAIRTNRTDRPQVRPHVAWPCIRIGDIFTKDGRNPWPWAHPGWNSLSNQSIYGKPFIASDKVKTLLLYAHGITLTDMLFLPGALLASGSENQTFEDLRGQATSFLSFILDIAPLIESGIVDFLPPALNFGFLTSDVDDVFLSIYLNGKSFPQEESRLFSILDEKAASHLGDITDKEIANAIREARGDIRRKLFQSAIDDLEAQLSYAILFDEKRTLLAGSSLHIDALQLIFSSLDVETTSVATPSSLQEIRADLKARISGHLSPGDVETRPLSTLLKIGIPGMDTLTSKDIVQIRQKSELFEEWRIGLSTALHELGRADWNSHRFSSQIEAHLGDVAERAGRELKRQSVADRLYGEARTFAIGLLPAMAVAGDARSAAAASLLFRFAGGLSVPTSTRPRQSSPASALVNHYLALTASSDS